jgi:hypothetical protein
LKSGVAVEKLTFRLEQPKFGGCKMSCDPRRSLITHPNAILFLRISGEGVFQQPRAIAQVCAFYSPFSVSMSDIAIFRQPFSVVLAEEKSYRSALS